MHLLPKSKNRSNYCAAQWCNNFSGMRLDGTDETVSFFTLPKEESRAKKWIQFTQREDLIGRDVKELKYLRLCSDHFHESGYRKKYPKPLLTLDAVPSVHGGTLSTEDERSSEEVVGQLQHHSSDLVETTEQAHKTELSSMDGVSGPSGSTGSTSPLGKRTINRDGFPEGAGSPGCRRNVSVDESVGKRTPRKEVCGTQLPRTPKRKLLPHLRDKHTFKDGKGRTGTALSAVGERFVGKLTRREVNARFRQEPESAEQLYLVLLPNGSISKVPRVPCGAVPPPLMNQGLAPKVTVLDGPDPSPILGDVTSGVSAECGRAREEEDGVETGTFEELVDASSSEGGSELLEEGGSPPYRDGQCGDEEMEEFGLEMLTRSILSTSEGGTSVTLTDPYYKYKLCRLCFKGGKGLRYIFGMDFKEFCLKDALEDLVHFKVSKSDEYPQQICEGCLPTLIKFKHFKDQFLEDKALFDEELKKMDKQVMTQDESLQEGDTEKLTDLDHAYARAERSGDVLDRRKPSADGETTINPESSLKDERITNKDYDMDRNDQDENLRFEIDESSAVEEIEGDAVGDGESALPEPAPVIRGTKNMIRDAQGMFVCPHCDQVFRYYNHRNDHIREHEKEFPFGCTYCDRRYKSLMKLNSHIIVHSNYMPYECEDCGQKFRLRTTLLHHKDTHSEVNNYLCAHCGRGFKHYSVFFKHVKYVHGDKRTELICDACGKEFERGCQLRDHVTKVHGPRVQHECNLCGKSFSLKRYLDRHRRERCAQRMRSATRMRATPRKRIKAFDE